MALACVLNTWSTCALSFFYSTTVQYWCYPLLSYSVTPFTAEGGQVWKNKEPLTLASRVQSLKSDQTGIVYPSCDASETGSGEKKERWTARENTQNGFDGSLKLSNELQCCDFTCQMCLYWKASRNCEVWLLLFGRLLFILISAAWTSEQTF